MYSCGWRTRKMGWIRFICDERSYTQMLVFSFVEKMYHYQGHAENRFCRAAKILMENDVIPENKLYFCCLKFNIFIVLCFI